MALLSGATESINKIKVMETIATRIDRFYNALKSVYGPLIQAGVNLFEDYKRFPFLLKGVQVIISSAMGNLTHKSVKPDFSIVIRDMTLFSFKRSDRSVTK